MARTLLAVVLLLVTTVTARYVYALTTQGYQHQHQEHHTGDDSVSFDPPVSPPTTKISLRSTDNSNNGSTTTATTIPRRRHANATSSQSSSSSSILPAGKPKSTFKADSVQHVLDELISRTIHVNSSAGQSAVRLQQVLRDAKAKGKDATKASASESPLFDKTIFYNASIPRHYDYYDYNSDSNNNNSQSYVLLLTNYGWNHPNQTHALQYMRSIRQRELLQGIVDHPHFHPTAWQDLKAMNATATTPPNTRYYVFLDLETCLDKNYPRYGWGLENLDRDYGRQQCCGLQHEAAIQDALSQPIFQFLPTTKLVVFNCAGYVKRHSLKYWMRGRNDDPRLAVASLSAHQHHQLPMDQGLPPPAMRTCTMTGKDRETLWDSRPFTLVFSGKFQRGVRRELLALHNDRDILILQPQDIRIRFNLSDPGEAFSTMARNSVFAAVPRGDNLYSYRFTEVMSCGAIPVVYSDGWALPFNQYVVDWNSTVVVIPEGQANDTVSILNQLSAEERCRLQHASLEVYEAYLANAHANIRGLVDGLEGVLSNQAMGTVH